MEEERKKEIIEGVKELVKEGPGVISAEPPRKNIYAALAKAQGTFEKFYKNEDNTYFKSKYLTLAQIFIGIKKPLAENGIAVLQFPTVDYSTPAAPLVHVKTVLALDDRDKIENVFSVRAKAGDVQSVGSAVTYARRYALQCLLGIAADEDDDGNAAASVEPPARPARKETSPKKTEPRRPDPVRNPPPDAAVPPAPAKVEQVEASELTPELTGTSFEENWPAPYNRDDDFNMDPTDTEKFLRCEQCGQAIRGHKDGVSTADATRARYGRQLCRECGAKEEAKRKKAMAGSKE